MLPEHVQRLLADAECLASDGASLQHVLPLLRRLSLDDFGLVLWSMPNADLPGLSSVLPAMVPVEVQKGWTGVAGSELLLRSTWFPRLLNEASWEFRGHGLQGARMLDVGCGYGRLIRLLYYYTDPECVTGVDPWPESFARAGTLPSRVLLVDELPESYPVESIDVAYAFSVFSHLSKRAMLAVMSAVRATLARDGLFVFTVRPVEYWPSDQYADPVEMARQHRETGFAHSPHFERGDYGDTSVSLEYLSALNGWRMLRYERSLTDPNQIAVIASPSRPVP